MDFFEDEMVSAFEQDFENYVSKESNELSSSNSINILSSNSITSLYNFPRMAPAKQLNPNNDSKRSINRNRAFPLENPKPVNPEEIDVVAQDFRSQSLFNISSENINQNSQENNKKSRARPPSQNSDHIIAERRRREQLSRLFISLSAIVPGLKKTDKSSILGGAIKYLKDLQERVETLEKLFTKTTMESVLLLKKSQISMDNVVGSSDKKSGGSDEEMLPEIVAKVIKNNILLKVYCGKQKGVVANLLGKVESLNLIVANTNVTPFGSLALDIIITAEMEKEFNLTVKEVVSALREALCCQ